MSGTKVVRSPDPSDAAARRSAAQDHAGDSLDPPTIAVPNIDDRGAAHHAAGSACNVGQTTGRDLSRSATHEGADARAAGQVHDTVIFRKSGARKRIEYDRERGAHSISDRDLSARGFDGPMCGDEGGARRPQRVKHGPGADGGTVLQVSAIDVGASLDGITAAQRAEAARHYSMGAIEAARFR